MKVYIVTNGEYDSYHIDKVFLSKEDAENYLSNFDDIHRKQDIDYYTKLGVVPLPSYIADYEYNEDATIEEWEVD